MFTKDSFNTNSVKHARRSNRRGKKYQWLAGAIVVGIFGTSYAHAASWDNVNLTSQYGLYKGAGIPDGNTYYDGSADGSTPLTSGAPNTFLFRINTQYATASRLYDNSANALPPAFRGSESEVVIPRFIYWYPWQPKNKHLRFATDALFPIVTVHANTGPQNSGFGGGGLGGITWAPIDIVYTWHNKNMKLMTIPGLYLTIPVGGYVPSNIINTNPNAWAATFTEETWLTFRHFYHLQIHTFFNYEDYFGRNSDYLFGGSHYLTRKITGSPTASFGNGNMVQLETDLTAPVAKIAGGTLHVGPNIDWQESVQNDTLNGKTIYGTRQVDVGIGPDIWYQKGRLTIWFKAAYSVHARNDYNTNYFNLNVQYAF